MKQLFRKAFFKLGGCVASVAMLLALTSVSNTCMFMVYQPDVPEELL